VASEFRRWHTGRQLQGYCPPGSGRPGFLAWKSAWRRIRTPEKVFWTAEKFSRTAEKVSWTAEKVSRTAEKFSRTAVKVSWTPEKVFRTAEKFSWTAEKVSRTAEKVSRTAEKFSWTAVKISWTAVKISWTAEKVSRTPETAPGTEFWLQRGFTPEYRRENFPSSFYVMEDYMPGGDWLPGREQDFADLCQKWKTGLEDPAKAAAFGWNQADLTPVWPR
jgi:hypothetical protein